MAIQSLAPGRSVPSALRPGGRSGRAIDDRSAQFPGAPSPYGPAATGESLLTTRGVTAGRPSPYNSMNARFTTTGAPMR